MFDFGKQKRKEEVDALKTTIDECATLKSEIEVLMEKSKTISSEEFIKTTKVLDDYDKLKEEILSYKNNPDIKPKNKFVAISGKKDRIKKMKTDLMAAKKMLEVY